MHRPVRPAKSPTLRSIPADLAFLFEEPPLLRHEDSNNYWALVDALGAAVSPVNAISALWVRDVADITFEIMRMRAWQPAIIAHEQRAAQCTNGAIDLTAIEFSLGPLERLSQLLAVAEMRRNNALREIQRFESQVAEKLRLASDRALAADGEGVPSGEERPSVPRVRLLRQAGSKR